MKHLMFLLIILIAMGLPFISAEGRTKSSTYVHEDPGFSFEYPADYREEPTQTPIEVARFANQNEFKLPVFTVNVRDRLDTELMDLPERIVKSMKESFPNTSDYVITREKRVKLSDGSEAVSFQFTWVWDGETVMETAMVSTYTDDKQITVSGTTITGLDISINQITKYCMTLRLTP
jgi:hypothetical protein